MSASPSCAANDSPAASLTQRLAQRFAQVREHSVALAAPLSAEDQCIQSFSGLRLAQHEAC